MLRLKRSQRYIVSRRSLTAGPLSNRGYGTQCMSNAKSVKGADIWSTAIMGGFSEKGSVASRAVDLERSQLCGPLVRNIGNPDIDPVTVGDLNSTARGTGARKSAGKPPMELISWATAAGLLTQAEGGDGLTSLWVLGRFQKTHDPHRLREIVRLLYPVASEAMREASLVLDFGRRKYAEWNWAKGMPWSVPVGCIARHLVRLIEGEVNDSESGLPHKAHIVCNILFLLEYAESYPEGNDLPTVWLPIKSEQA